MRFLRKNREKQRENWPRGLTGSGGCIERISCGRERFDKDERFLGSLGPRGRTYPLVSES